MLDFEESNVLGQLLDTTWGRSSTPGTASVSVKGNVSGNRMVLTYTSYATFASNVAMSQQLPRLIDEGKKITDQFVKKVKSDFKEASGKTLGIKVISASPSVEVISLQPHISPKRTIAFRYVTLTEIS